MPHHADATELATIINALPTDSDRRSALQEQLERQTDALVEPTARQKIPARHEDHLTEFEQEHQRWLQEVEQEHTRCRRRRITGITLAVAVSLLVPIVLVVAAFNADAPTTGGGLLFGSWVAAYLEVCAWTNALDSLCE